MKILVANLGSTSFKYRVFQMEGEEASTLAKGGYERVEDFGAVIEDCLSKLRAEGILAEGEDLSAVGFKTVLGDQLSGCVEADDRVLDALDSIRAIAPSHNPAYAAGIRQFARLLPSTPRVALFETAFYQWMDEAATRYAVPERWHRAGVRRSGFHGASHKFVTERAAALCDRPEVESIVRDLYLHGPQTTGQDPFRVISCHLGGSSSVTLTVDGVARGCSFGLSPQSGLPQNNRAGDLDSMAIPFAMSRLGIDLETAMKELSSAGGLLGLSEGKSNDLRDLRTAAERGHQPSALAIDTLVHSIRHWIGAFFFQAGGADALVFTGGIGENNPWLREQVLAGTEDLGIIIDAGGNQSGGKGEMEFTGEQSRTRLLVIPTNEELVVAREARRLLISKS